MLLLMAPDAPTVDLSGMGEGDTASMSAEEHRKQVVASLVGEIVLCVKEVSLHLRRSCRIVACSHRLNFNCEPKRDEMDMLTGIGVAQVCTCGEPTLHMPR